jgi:hypothetical protein
MNRPQVYYDYCNFSSSEIPRFKDGWESYKEISREIEIQILKNSNSNNFFFIEKFNPGHITGVKITDSSVENERLKYIKSLQIANVWLKKIISIIGQKDPNAIIIIGADHGGFVGFAHTLQAQDKIVDQKLLNSIFGAKLAIKWNDMAHINYDKKLKTPVNLFRILFSYLSENTLFLDNLQPDASYNCYDATDFTKVYKAIDENGSTLKQLN